MKKCDSCEEPLPADPKGVRKVTLAQGEGVVLDEVTVCVLCARGVAVDGAAAKTLRY